MADAIFLNATPFATALNLNGNVANQQVEPMPPPAAADPPRVVLPGAAVAISINKGPNVFGASTPGASVDNLLITFSTGFATPGIWHLQSTVSAALNLYFYLFDDQVVGVDQTGSTAGITIRRGSIQERLLVMARFPAVPGAFPTLP
jgi:hypothetical protein